MKKNAFTVVLLTITALFLLMAEEKTDQNEQEELIRLLDDYGNFLKERDFEAWGMLHSENVVKMPPDAPPTTNRADMVSGILQTATFFDFYSFEVDVREVTINGKRAQSWGVYNMELKSRDGGPTILVDGKFLTLFMKDDQGRWVITHDCFNSNVPPPPMP